MNKSDVELSQNICTYPSKVKTFILKHIQNYEYMQTKRLNYIFYKTSHVKPLTLNRGGCDNVLLGQSYRAPPGAVIYE